MTTTSPARNDLPSPEARARQLGLFVDAYGLDAAERAQLITLMVEHAIHDAANEITGAGRIDMVDAPTQPPGGPESDPLWALTWRVRSAAWLVRHRQLLEAALRAE